MPRRLVFGLLLCAALAGNASAQIGSLEIEVSGEYASKYIWNGFDRIRSQGLEMGPVLQPKVSVGLGRTPLHVAAGGSFLMNGQSELHETTYHVYVQRFASPFTRVGMGYTYYDDRISPVTGASDRDVHEFWSALDSRNMAGVHTGVELKYEVSARDAYDAFFFANAEFGYTYAVVPPTATGLSLDLGGMTRILYNTRIEAQGVELVQSGFSAWQLGLTADFRAAGVRVTPFVTYQSSLEEAVNDEDPLWAGISVAYAF